MAIYTHKWSPKISGVGWGEYLEKIFKEIMANIFPNLKKAINSKFQDSQQVLSKETWKKRYQGTSLSNCLKPVMGRKS